MEIPKLPPLSKQQEALAREIRKRWVRTDLYEDAPVAFALSVALAQVIDGVSRNGIPTDVQNALKVLEMSYLTLFGDQHMGVLTQILGDTDTVKRVMSHVNGKSIVDRIFARTGPLVPGKNPAQFSVADILEEEGFHS